MLLESRLRCLKSRQHKLTVLEERCKNTNPLHKRECLCCQIVVARVSFSLAQSLLTLSVQVTPVPVPQRAVVSATAVKNAQISKCRALHIFYHVWCLLLLLEALSYQRRTFLPILVLQTQYRNEEL